MSGTLQLRPYQSRALEDLERFFVGNPTGHPLLVVPTGGGKSLILAEFIRDAIKSYPGTRILVLTHVRELIRQNAAEFAGQAPDIHHGIYSAGLGQRDTENSVLFAGIQSIYQRAYELGRFDLVIIDEAHLVPKKGMGRYREYLNDLLEINPDARFIGLTATPYRLDGGYLHKGNGRIFTHIAHEVLVEELIEEGYLAPLVSKSMKSSIDTSKVKKSAGDFNLKQLEAAATGDGMVQAAVSELVRLGRDRRHWLIFGIGIDHAHMIQRELRLHGIEAPCVFGHTKRDERDETIAAFKNGKLRALINVGVLTTGFNAPRLDLLAVMRPTQSAALYVQIMGRGMRCFPGKENCLVLDYGENVERHGPINRVRPKKEGEAQDAPQKVCPECQTIMLLALTVCPECGYEWPASEDSNPMHATEASELSPFDLDWDKPQIHEVDQVRYGRHKKFGKPDSLRVDYHCGLRLFSEWVCIEHEGFARQKAQQWWSQNSGQAAPKTVDEALTRTQELEEPTHVAIKRDGKYERVWRRWREAPRNAEAS